MVSGDAELCFLTATELARRIRRARCPRARWCGAPRSDRARQPGGQRDRDARGRPRRRGSARGRRGAARAARRVGPLHGLPIAIKDLVADAGMRTTFGSPMYRDFVPDADDAARRARCAAGAIIIGKTNTPEFGAGSQTFNAVFGATRNPYDLTKTCGGSSGGAAVALACGMLPLADGTRSRRLAAQPGRASATSSASGRRPAACRAGRRERVATRWRCTVRWRAPSTDVRCCCRAMAGPDPRVPIVAARAGQRFRAAARARLRRAARSRGARDLGGAIPSSPRSRAVCDARASRRSRRSAARSRTASPTSTTSTSCSRRCGRAGFAPTLGESRPARDSSRTRSSGTSSRGSS